MTKYHVRPWVRSQARKRKTKSVRKKMALECIGGKYINTSIQPNVFIYNIFVTMEKWKGEKTI